MKRIRGYFESRSDRQADLLNTHVRWTRWLIFSVALLLVHATSIAQFGVRGLGPP